VGIHGVGRNRDRPEFHTAERFSSTPSFTPPKIISAQPFQSHPHSRPQTPPNSPATLKSMRRRSAPRPESRAARGGKGRVHAWIRIRTMASFRISAWGPSWPRFTAPSQAPTLASFRNYAGVDLAAGNLGRFSPGSPPSPHTVQEHPLYSSTYHPNSPATLESKRRGGLGWVHSGSGAHELASIRTPGHGPNWLRFATSAYAAMAPVFGRVRLAVLDADAEKLAESATHFFFSRFSVSRRLCVRGTFPGPRFRCVSPSLRQSNCTLRYN
jgi:hypothetical protein